MKYSIILPVRNGGHYVKECVQSVLTQTNRDFNFIVLDNCSTDGTLEWLRSLQNRRIEIIPSTRPLTIEENWGRVKEIEKNDFITLIGHDDILYPTFLENIEALQVKYPDAGLYHTHFVFIDAAGKKIRPSKQMKEFYKGSEFLKAFLTSSIDSMGTGYVMRSRDYDALGGMQGKYPNLLFADFELWISLAVKSFAVVSVQTCFAFRIHKSTTSVSQDYKLHTALDAFVNFLVSLRNTNEELGQVVQEYGGGFLLHYCKAYSHRLLRTPVEKREGLSVAHFINKTIIMADRLGVRSSYHPVKSLPIQLALRIDESSLLRYLFLVYKKVVARH